MIFEVESAAAIARAIYGGKNSDNRQKIPNYTSPFDRDAILFLLRLYGLFWTVGSVYSELGNVYNKIYFLITSLLRI